MNLIYKSNKYLLHSRRVGRKALKRRKKFRRIEVSQRQALQGKDLKEQERVKAFFKYTEHVSAPVNCSFLY